MNEVTRWGRASRAVELAANVGIVVLVVVAIALFLKQPPTKRISAASPPRAPAAGSRIALPGATFSHAERTLVLVLSTGCHFCSDSGPFYRRIAADAREHGTSVVAVLPQTTEEAGGYLAKLGLSVEKVFQIKLSAMNTSATPTLILVSRQGVVKKAWIGLLDEDKEDEVLKAVKGLS